MATYQTEPERVEAYEITEPKLGANAGDFLVVRPNGSMETMSPTDFHARYREVKRRVSAPGAAVAADGTPRRRGRPPRTDENAPVELSDFQAQAATS